MIIIERLLDWNARGWEFVMGRVLGLRTSHETEDSRPTVFQDPAQRFEFEKPRTVGDDDEEGPGLGGLRLDSEGEPPDWAQVREGEES